MTETKDKEYDLFEGYNFQEAMVKQYEEEVLQFERFMRKNIYDFHRPSGSGNSDMWHVWSAITDGYEDAKTNWRKSREELVDKQNWLIKRGMIPQRPIGYEVPELSSDKDIQQYAQWNYLVWDYASRECLKKDVEWAKDRFENFVIDKINHWWSREEYRLSWKQGTPDILRQIKAELVLDNGNYNNISLFTKGGDHFLKLEYHGRDGQSGGFSYDDKYGIYTVLENFYRDIFVWLKSLRESE